MFQQQLLKCDLPSNTKYFSFLVERKCYTLESKVDQDHCLCDLGRDAYPLCDFVISFAYFRNKWGNVGELLKDMEYIAFTSDFWGLT